MSELSTWLREYSEVALERDDAEMLVFAANEVERLQKELEVCQSCKKRGFTRTQMAELIRETKFISPLFNSMTARAALDVAARAVLRGRHLTEDERRENLRKALEEEHDVSE